MFISETACVTGYHNRVVTLTQIDVNPHATRRKRKRIFIATANVAKRIISRDV